jgi:hypothetical protein
MLPREKGVTAMDRNEALKLLKGGREAIVEWNRQRKSEAQIPCLNKAKLSGADLSGANIRGANLNGPGWKRRRLLSMGSTSRSSALS